MGKGKGGMGFRQWRVLAADDRISFGIIIRLGKEGLYEGRERYWVGFRVAGIDNRLWVLNG